MAVQSTALSSIPECPDDIEFRDTSALTAPQRSWSIQDVQVTHRGGFGGIEKMHDDTALAPIGGSVCAAAAVFFCRAAFDCDAEACGTYGWGLPVIFVAATATGVAILLLIIAAVGVLATARRHTATYSLGVPFVVLLCVTFA